MKKYVVTNFHFSVVLSIVASLLLLVMPQLVVPYPSDGDNYLGNLIIRIAIGAAVVQSILWWVSYRKLHGQFSAFLIGTIGVLLGQYIDEHRGADLILTMTNLETVANVAYYIGFSHLLYFLFTTAELQEFLKMIFNVRR
jgi:hypothetical protein